MDKDNGAPYLGMLCLRSTPVDSKLPSPAELLQQRPFRDDLPKLIKTAEDDIVNHFQQKQQTQKGLYDRHAKPVSSLSPGQNCRMRDFTTWQWQPAVIKEARVEPWSYTITNDKGNEVRRNRSHVRPAATPATSDLPVTTTTNELPVVTSKSGRIIKPPQCSDL